MPLKIAPATKYGPKIVVCHIGTGAIEKSNETIVCTGHGDRDDGDRHDLHRRLEPVPLLRRAAPAERAARQ